MEDELKQSRIILVVDDDDANRYVVSRILRQAGFLVQEAATGTDALELATEQPDLIILDIKLPDINGFEVCQQLKAEPTTSLIPVLHLSAFKVSAADKVHGLDSGADGYLTHPVNPLELIATVKALLRIRQTEKQLQQSEEKFRAIFNQTFQHIGILSPIGSIIQVNQSALDFAGQKLEDVVGRLLWEMPWFSSFTSTQEQLQKAIALAATGKFVRYEVQMQGCSGKVATFDFSLKPILDEMGNAVQLVYEGRDISDRKRAEDELRRANQVKDEFLAVLSHELRSPLNAILGWSQLLRTRKVDQLATFRALETIERNAKLQTQMIEDLLDISRIIRGKIELNIARANLVSAIEGAIATMQLAAQAKSIQIQTVLDPNGAIVLGDINRLQQIVWNLLSNAIKFTPPGGQVEVKLEKVQSERGLQISDLRLQISDEHNTSFLQSEISNLKLTQSEILNPKSEISYARITVKDTGKGISADFLPYAFDYFRQADSSMTRNHGGLGLGLAIVRHLVELHGGMVDAQSAGEGQGATFTVMLPLMNDRSQTKQQGNGWESYADLTGVQVLVVDDERDTREYITFVLEEFGAAVTAVASANEGIETLDKWLPDVLVSDIGMPGKDGYALMREIRERSPAQGGNIPAIALTAYAREEDTELALLAGFQMHVSKPVEPERLVSVVASLIANC
ncbi:MAG TPA: hybrid sensor histidine kinase/response regulator [Cyanobacteria bacterium UBA11369]|nr:hybrid sensor histidine kinase/response regulator [Cyanobacteria bacterium UBA11371]HBE50320.1 hybrid sensor histidine kinase/response regulator [Cyanobacteria bacterium UBA11369]